MALTFDLAGFDLVAHNIADDLREHCSTDGRGSDPADLLGFHIDAEAGYLRKPCIEGRLGFPESW
jgi:hypothetical protein